MGYPFPSFGAILFQRNEMPIDGSDVGWNRNMSYARSKGLGSAVDDIQVLSIGSLDRSWEARYSPDRYAALNALVGTTADLCDWERPVPQVMRAFLARMTQVRWEARECSDGSTERVIRTRVEFVSQNAPT